MNKHLATKIDGKYLLTLSAIILLTACDAAPLDDTDNKVTGERSGLVIKIDNGTGCQYLAYERSITPRLDSFGVPICNIKSHGAINEQR